MEIGMLIALCFGLGTSNIVAGKLLYGSWKDGFIYGALSAVVCFLLGLFFSLFTN